MHAVECSFGLLGLLGLLGRSRTPRAGISEAFLNAVCLRVCVCGVVVAKEGAVVWGKCVRVCAETMDGLSTPFRGQSEMGKAPFPTHTSSVLGSDSKARSDYGYKSHTQGPPMQSTVKI